MFNKLCIKSDFTDFYDNLASENALVTYNRCLSECMQRGKALNYLRSIGINTIKLQQVNTFTHHDGNIIVYTNPKAHHGEGKIIMSSGEANLCYSNYLGTRFIPNENGVTIKYLQIGKRRFTLYFKKDNIYSLDLGTLVNVTEATNEYNLLIGLPIFSIDYISDESGAMVATDFNEVENLGRLGMERYISANDVMNEIKASLEIYNKI